MARGTRTTLAPGIYQDRAGITAVAAANGYREEARYTLGTPLAEMQAWRQKTVTALKKRAPQSAHGRGTLAADAATYLASVTSMPSYEARRADLEAWLPRFGQRARPSLTVQELKQQLNDWAEAGYAASTINHRRQALRDCLRFHDPDGVPVIDGTSRRKPPPLQARALAWQDVLDIVAALRDTKSDAMLRVMAFTGFPQARISRLLPAHLNVKAQTVFLEGRRKGEGTPSKTLPITEAAVEALQMYFRHFPKGGAVQRHSWKVAFMLAVAAANQRRAEAGEPLIPAPPVSRPYDLRHSYGTEMFRRDGDLSTVAEALDVTLETAQRYTLGAVAERVAKAVAKMNEAAPRPKPRLVRRTDDAR